MRYNLLPLVAAMLLAACEGAPYPLSAPDAHPVDDALVGSWEMTAPEDSASERLHIWGFNDHEYYVEYGEYRLEGGEWIVKENTRLRAFMTAVAGRRFVNLQCIGCDDSTWLFMDVDQPDPKDLVLTPIDDDLYEQFKDAPNADAVRQVLMDALPGALDLDNVGRFRRYDSK